MVNISMVHTVGQHSLSHDLLWRTGYQWAKQ